MQWESVWQRGISTGGVEVNRLTAWTPEIAPTLPSRCDFHRVDVGSTTRVASPPYGHALDGTYPHAAKKQKAICWLNCFTELLQRSFIPDGNATNDLVRTQPRIVHQTLTPIMNRNHGVCSNFLPFLS